MGTTDDLIWEAEARMATTRQQGVHVVARSRPASHPARKAMPKSGILHDYDLHANQSPGAKPESVCAVCDASPVTYQWSDYSGEAMCTRCGCAYQLQWGSDTQKAEGAYPYLSIKPEWVPVLRRHWAETQRFVCMGTMFGPQPGLEEFTQWVTVNNAAPVAPAPPETVGEATAEG